MWVENNTVEGTFKRVYMEFERDGVTKVRGALICGWKTIL
jgi:hypothetical protein